MAHDARYKHREHGKGNRNVNVKKLQPSKAGVKKKPVSLKNQIRGIERLLRKEGLDARVRKKEEAKLQELKLAIEEHKRAEKERMYAVRYHKIRFFERIKLERTIKRAEKQIAEASKEGDSAPTALVEHLARLQDDLQYVVHFPKGEKYVSILRNAEDPAAQAALTAERERLRALIHKQQADSALLTEADEGAALLARQRRPTQQPTAVTHAAANVPATEESQEDDDFFTPNDLERSGSDGEQFHSVPRTSKADAVAPARHRPAEAPGTAQRTKQSHTAVSGAAEHRPGAHDRAPSAAAAPAITAAEEDMAADDDFFMRDGESECDSDAASSEEQDDDTGPRAPPVHDVGGAALRTGAAAARGQPAEVGSAQRHAGSAGRREGSGAPGSSQHQHGGGKPGGKGGRKPAGGAHPKQAFAAQRVAGGPHGPRKPATGVQRPPFKGRGHPAAGVGKHRAAEAAPSGKQPVRTRAEGGRKRRK